MRGWKTRYITCRLAKNIWYINQGKYPTNRHHRLNVPFGWFDENNRSPEKAATKALEITPMAIWKPSKRPENTTHNANKSTNERKNDRSNRFNLIGPEYGWWIVFESLSKFHILTFSMRRDGGIHCIEQPKRARKNSVRSWWDVVGKRWRIGSPGAEMRSNAISAHSYIIVKNNWNFVKFLLEAGSRI